MKLQNKRGFTLIELLVVITIIGILATGATATYTTQIQKARDTNRISDLKAIQSAAEQVYQDRSEYPPSGNYFFKDGSGDAGVAIGTYLQKLPRDPKNGQTCNDGGGDTIPACVYTYIVNKDDNGIDKGAFVLSTAFESEGKVTTDAKKDGGKQNVRREIGNGLSLESPLDVGLTAHSSELADNLKGGTGVLSEEGESITNDNWSTQGTIITLNGS